MNFRTAQQATATFLFASRLCHRLTTPLNYSSSVSKPRTDQLGTGKTIGPIWIQSLSLSYSMLSRKKSTIMTFSWPMLMNRRSPQLLNKKEDK